MEKQPSQKRYVGCVTISSESKVDTVTRLAKLSYFVRNRYLASGEFRGLSVRELELTPTLQRDIEQLILDRCVDLVRGDVHPNPNIKAVPADGVSVQLGKIHTCGLGNGCLYPTPESLASCVKRKDYAGRPFTLEMAFGSPQLAARVFDVSVLDYYENSPEYKYHVDESCGSIFRLDEYLEDNFPAREMTVIERFGFCCSAEGRIGVAVFLRDLHALFSDEQAHWQKHLVAGKFSINAFGLI